MLGLLARTDPAWADAAQADLAALLSDHAHCELKAAQSALSLLARFGGELPQLIEPLTALAKEETEHFHEVQQKLSALGGTLSRPRTDNYVRELQAAAREERREDGDEQTVPALLDRLLVCALIEGRSCERFRLLAERLSDPSLRGFYRELMASEAKHFRLFCSLAEQSFGAEATRARFVTLAEREAKIASKLPLGPQIHG
jgi:tRNA-(ms[2]io[6]A)-hydroxylase